MSCCSACGQHACACGCGEPARTPVSLYNRPGLPSLSYRVGTYADFMATMQIDLSAAVLPALQGLRTRDPGDPSMALLDAWAIGADVISFYQERIANEGYLRTATERCSVLQLGRLIDYRLRPGVSASVYLAYTLNSNSPPVTIPAGSKAQSVPAPGQQMQTFETAETLEARSEWNTLRPRITQPQNISLDTVAGLNELWVVGANANLKANDQLLYLFDDLATGVTAIRRVASAEAQQTDPATGAMLQPLDQRTHVLLQPLDPVTVQIVAAANKAIQALSTADATWLQSIEDIRQKLLLGHGNGGSVIEFTRIFAADLEGSSSGPQAVQDFTQAVQLAFGGSAPVTKPAPMAFDALFGALMLPPTLQPANSLRLQRSTATALGVASDTRPQMLLNFATPLIDTFYRAWTNVPQGNPSPNLSGVFAMRLEAPLFGYNAPSPMMATQSWDSTNSQWVSKTQADPNGLAIAESQNVLWLDNAYDGVVDGSYVLIQPTVGIPMVGQVQGARTMPRTAYGISGKSTQITLAGNEGADHTWPAVPDEATLRGTVVYAQSEELPLAELVINDDVGNIATTSAGVANDGATRLTLDTPVDGLKAGRWVVVQGQRTDVPGTDTVAAAEAVMLLAVEQGTAPDLPGDTVHTTLVFANQGLAYTYKRSSLTIQANVVRATHGETRNEVLGNGDGSVAMPSFALKQAPLTYVSAPTVDGVRSTLQVVINGMQWHEERSLAGAAPADRRFATSTGDSGKTNVIFGNGVHGARVPTGIENLVATYRNGIGTPGNVDAGQISLLATKPLGVKDVINPLAATGGADAETRDQARRNAPLAVLALDRLVSVADYADFARTFGGVGKASAAKLGGQVWVTIAGAGDVPVDKTSDLYVNLLQAMQRYGDPSLSVGLNVRELIALTLSAKIGLQADFTWDAVEPVLRTTLLDRFGFERRDLAQSVYLSQILACMQGVRGVAWVDMDAFGSLDEATILAGFDIDTPTNGDGSEVVGRVGSAALASAPAAGSAQTSDGVNSSVVVLGTRYDANGMLKPAQIACFLADVPDTLLLQEATS